MKIYVFTLLCFLCVIKSNAQDSIVVDRQIRFPAWITHSANKDIIGLSFAAFPKGVLRKDTTLTRTYGVRLEVSLLAVLSPLMGRSPVSSNEKQFSVTQNTNFTEIIYGINLSSGTFGETKVNGFSAGLLIQYLYNMNGIAAAGMSNLMEKHNGLAVSFLGNESYKSNGILVGLGNNTSYQNGIQIAVLGNDTSYINGLQIGGFNRIDNRGYGLQIGIFNSAKNFKGVQIGLWNKNDKRSLPIINWNFKN